MPSISIQDMNFPMHLQSKWLSLSPFEASLSEQENAVQSVSQTESPTGLVIGQEHPTVITLGRSTQEQDWPTDRSLAKVIDRGGKATLHSPGQLVIYPILPLRKLRLGVADFIEDLNQITIEWAELLGCEIQFRKDDPGFYKGEEKVGFIGIRVKNGVSFHGLSLNIRNDLTLFNQIVSCGVAHRKIGHIDSEQELPLLFHTWFSIAQKTWQRYS